MLLDLIRDPTIKGSALMLLEIELLLALSVLLETALVLRRA